MKTIFAGLATFALALGAGMLPSTALAQECSTGLCGTPDQSGGGCGCGCGSILIAMTDRGDSYQFADDFDGDGIEDEFDNCPFASNWDQADSDGEGVGDVCDSCPAVANLDQANMDGDAFGDLCDDDRDGDDIPNAIDNCMLVPNNAQVNTDGDSMGNACDPNDDNDAFDDIDDPCRLAENDAVTGLKIGGGDCDDDPDKDGVFTADDNCANMYNPIPVGATAQLDTDSDGIGDKCDRDIDGDNVLNWEDNCKDVFNPAPVAGGPQIDRDRDGLGDGGGFGTNLAESCDQLECYEVAGDMSGCLNPATAFTTRLMLIGNTLRDNFVVGEEIVVAVLSNRLGEPHRWNARISNQPVDSKVVLDRPWNEQSGTTIGDYVQVGQCVSTDDNNECLYNFIRFQPDAPGTYVIRVETELTQGDPLNRGPSADIATITALVGGEKAGGCSASNGVGIWAAFLALGLVWLRRRK